MTYKFINLLFILLIFILQFEQFILDLYDVFEIDCLVTSHPIYVPVQNPDEINEIFDTISYSKVKTDGYMR